MDLWPTVITMISSDLLTQWGEQIRDLRQERGLSLRQLSQLAEIDYSQLWNAEHGRPGRAGLGDAARIRLATALGVRVEDIFEYPDTTKAAS